MDTDYITALEYARKHDRTKQWVIRLCHAGRIEGAYMAGGVWVVPADAPLPAPLKPGPKPNFDRTLARLAMDKARADRQAREAVERAQVAQIGGVLSPSLKATIDQVFADDGMFKSGGSFNIKGIWYKPPQGWNEAAWLYYQSLVAGKPVEAELEPWPRTEEQAMRKFDIGEGVADGMTLDEIKAQVKHWGADEQAYYDSLVSGTLNAL